MVLSLATSYGWCLCQLDVNYAFLQGTLIKDVFMAQPQGFTDTDHPNHGCQLRKAIYGLKQAPRPWYNELKIFLLTFGFLNSTTNTFLFIPCRTAVTIYLLVYVDDITIIGNNSSAVHHFITLLSARFSLKDLGPLTYFLSVEVLSHQLGLILSQQRYIANLLTRDTMTKIYPIANLSYIVSSFLHCPI